MGSAQARLIFSNPTHYTYVVRLTDSPKTIRLLKPNQKIILAPNSYTPTALQIFCKNTSKPALLHVCEVNRKTVSYTILESSYTFDIFQLNFDEALDSKSDYYTDCIYNKNTVYAGNISSAWYKASLPSGVKPVDFIKYIKSLYQTYFSQTSDKMFIKPDNITRIPKILHHIWIGPRPLPQDYKISRDRWKNMHQNWQHKLWTDDDLKNFIWSSTLAKQAFEKSKNYTAKADILKLEILYKFGGVYTDLDTEPFEPLDSLTHMFDFVALLYGPHLGTLVIDLFFLASVPSHPILARALKNCAELAHSPPDISHLTDNKEFIYNLISGVMPVTRAVWQERNNLRNLRTIILPIRYFNNYTLSPVSYGAHYPKRPWLTNKT